VDARLRASAVFLALRPVAVGNQLTSVPHPHADPVPQPRCPRRRWRWLAFISIVLRTLVFA
jgi:hypothetical protein